MLGFLGFFSLNHIFSKQQDYYHSLLQSMSDAFGNIHNEVNCLVDERYCIAGISQYSPGSNTDPAFYQVTHAGNRYTLCLTGEIFNTKSLKSMLVSYGCQFDSDSDCEVILKGYLKFGNPFISKLKGNFSATVCNPAQYEILLFRDCFGSKPLFYTIVNEHLVFSTKLKVLFNFPNVNPILNLEGCNEIFSLGPSRTPGNAVFKDIYEVLPGHCLSCSRFGTKQQPFWQLKALPHIDSYSETVEHTHALISDAVTSQLNGDASIGTLLSGGLDSAIVSKLAGDELKKQNKTLLTFSFDYEQNSNFFIANAFQPSMDRPYVDIMVSDLKSEHSFLICSQEKLADTLMDSLRAHDLPCMADIDSSLYYFCGLVSQKANVVLTGECADEVFGGYPWFHRLISENAVTFPWANDLSPRTSLLNKELLDYLRPDEYVQNAYLSTCSSIPYLPEDSMEMRSKRRAGYLSIYWFMQTLLNRMERCSISNNLCARIPFADRDLVEYVYNVPWSMKCKDQVEKHLLRSAFQSYLPNDILHRKKCPYPKTYHPAYEELLISRLFDVIADPKAPLRTFLDLPALNQFMKGKKDYGSPWYGQLMAGPQMLAYLLQVNQWVIDYQIDIRI